MSIDFTQENAKPFEFVAGDSAILLIHGFTGTPSHMRTIGRAVHEVGFSARGILLPGHGVSVEAMEKSNDKEWLNACRSAFYEMKGKYRRIAVGGLSMGGILSLILAAEMDPSAVILFAPALRYRTPINHLSPIAKHFMRMQEWGEHKYNPDEFLYDHDYGYTGAPVAKVEDMTRLQRMARIGLEHITCPALVIQSHKDESVHRTVPEMIMHGVHSQVKEICWVDRSPHVCTIGPDREYVNGRVIDFLQRFGV